MLERKKKPNKKTQKEPKFKNQEKTLKTHNFKSFSLLIMDYNTIKEEDLKLFIPSGIVVSGPSSSGKTQLVLKILEHANALFHPPPKAIG